MAIVTNIPEKKQSPSAMRGVLAYCTQAEKTRLDEKTVLVSGVHCVPELAYQSFLATQKLQECKPGQVRFYHYVQSFRSDDDLTPRQAHEIGLKLAKYFGSHETVVATHLDNGQLHNHFVVNAYDFTGGIKLHMNKFTLKEMRDLSDRLCAEYGASVLKTYDPAEKNTNLGSREYRAAVKGESWKFQLMAAIDDAMTRCGNQKEFIQEMRNRGYEITWTADRKNITYICPNGMKCRDRKLHERKYLKEEMEFEFRIRKRLTAELGFGDAQEVQRYRRADDYRRTVPAGGVCDPEGTLADDDEALAGGRAVPADPVQADRSTGNLGTDQLGSGQAAGNRGAVSASTGDESGDGKPGDTPEAGADHLTGWEDARGIYFQNLRSSQFRSAENGWTGFQPEPAHEQVPDWHGGSIGSAVGAGLRGVLAVTGLIDEDEDPEEKRKRIEAEENASNLGAMLGLAIAAAEALAEDEPQLTM